MFILVESWVTYIIKPKGNILHLPFITDRKKQLMSSMIIASALIPVYIAYIAFADASLWVSIFSIVYSLFIISVWFLIYFDFFKKKPTFNGTATNGNMVTKQQ
jgi:hypothetical protein